jgi:hypothetical protein
MQLFSANITIFTKKNVFSYENMKKPPLKDAHNQTKLFFSVLPTSPKPAQILILIQ